MMKGIPGVTHEIHTSETPSAKLHTIKQIEVVFEYFRYKDGTTLDCSTATGILRNCITWYIAQLESLGLIQAIYRAKDQRTGFMANYYSANPEKWLKSKDNKQLNLWEV